jgi:hypothetical protein
VRALTATPLPSTIAADRETLGSEPPESLSTVAAFSAAVAGAAGLLAGAAGLGGGSMLGSALLDFRVHPQVSAIREWRER